jgi:integrase
MAGRAGHRGWGNIRKLPSGRYQASYIGPDLTRHAAPTTFDDNDTAVVWLTKERALVESDEWTPPKLRSQQRRRDSFTVYSAAWLAHRPLKPRTVAHYRKLLDRLILPTFGALTVRHITPESVRVWHAGLDKATPTQNAHAYALLKAICKTAVDDDLLPANPCRVRGAGQAKRASRTTPATAAELAALIVAMPERYKAMTALAGWCGLRFGELIELRRKDIDRKAGVVKVRRAAALVDGKYLIGDPKSDAGKRDVVIPPHVLPIIRKHLDGMGVTGREALLFPAASDPAKHLRTASLAKVFYPARDKIGRPDLRWHDLRHTAGSNATRVGANLAEVMALLGHSTPAAALRYQHQTEGRATEIAAALSKLATGK